MRWKKVFFIKYHCVSTLLAFKGYTVFIDNETMENLIMTNVLMILTPAATVVGILIGTGHGDKVLNVLIKSMDLISNLSNVLN